MSGLDPIRGTCAGLPLELVGEFTGYHNEPTMHVGLWIRNDGDYLREARGWAQQYGTRQMAQYLTRILTLSGRYSPPGLAYWDAAEDDPELDTVDWAQIAYDLIGAEPDDEDLAAVRAVGNASSVHTLTDDVTWKLAHAARRKRVARWVLDGER